MSYTLIAEGHTPEALREQLEAEFGQVARPDGYEALERSTREQFSTAADAITGMVESGALGEGPYSVTLTGHATARHSAIEGERQMLTIVVAGKFTPAQRSASQQEGALATGRGPGALH